MSTTDLAVRDVSASLPLASPRLPRWAPVLVGVLAVAAAGLPALLLGWSLVAWLLLALVLFLVALPAWSLAVENRRAAVDRLMTSLVWTAFGVAVLPLVWLVWTVVSNGAGMITGEFLTFDMRNIVGDGRRHLPRADGHPAGHAGRRADLGAGGAVRRDLPGRVRQGQPPGALDHLPGRRDDRHPLDRGRPLRAGALRAGLRARGPVRASVARWRSRC